MSDHLPAGEVIDCSPRAERTVFRKIHIHDGRGGTGFPQFLRPAVRHGEQTTDPTGDRVLRHRRIGELTELLQVQYTWIRERVRVLDECVAEWHRVSEPLNKLERTLKAQLEDEIDEMEEEDDN